MNLKALIAGVVVIGALIFGSMSFVESNIEYGDFQSAKASTKKIQVKGEWIREKETHFDAASNQFTFFMKDAQNQEMKVVFDGAKPNNFELASHVVAKGRYTDGVFHASEILTKCPSKYEADSETVKKTI